MARDADSEALGANQSKRPASGFHDMGDLPQQQHPPLHHRSKSQKHIVGGTGGRLHARVPSSKGLLKHHTAASTTKLNRKHGSLSPDQGAGAALASHHHRRATSELKLTRDPSSTNLKKNPSHTILKRNRSQVEVGKRNKSSTNLNRSASNPAVNKLRSSGGSSKVQFNLGDEDQDDNQDDDEWVDASTSASPLLSRRGSAVSSAHTSNPPADEGDSTGGSPTPHAELQHQLGNGTRSGTQNGAGSPSRSKPTHNQYLTSRILSRTPSHGAPPMMSAETVSARPSSIRQPSPPDSSLGQAPYLSNTPGAAVQSRPGSSGKAELTSRFVGNNSQEPGSGMPGGSFILAANRGGLSRAAGNGKDALSMPKRRQSLGALSQARGIDALHARQASASEHPSDNDDDDDDDDDDDAHSHRAPRSARRSGEYALATEMNRTQQKLNLQRASSTLEPAHPHPGLGMVPPGVVVANLNALNGPLVGVPTTYDTRDPRVGKTLERTGMQYLTVRRHLNPVARSIARVMQLPGLENSRRIPQHSHHHHPSSSSSHHPSRHHASRLSEQFVPRTSSMADLIINNGPSNAAAARPRSTTGNTNTSTHTNGAFSALQSASSSLGTAATDDDGRHGGHGGQGAAHGAQGHGQGHGHGQGQGLSGSSLVDGAEDAGTMALLRMMWEKNPGALSASHE